MASNPRELDGGCFPCIALVSLHAGETTASLAVGLLVNWLSLLSRADGFDSAHLSQPAKDAIGNALEGKALTRESAFPLIECGSDSLIPLCQAASKLRDDGKGRTITYSPKVFLPLTRLCRDACGYCTFRLAPAAAKPLFMTLEEVVAVAREGKRAGCTEALFTLGERPEQRYPEAEAWLRSHGYNTTLEYLRDAAKRVLEETGLLPHLNPGTMSRREIALLRPVSASMGLMLENISPRLAEKGGPHEQAPSKRPRVRLKTLQLAGEEKVAFTSGLLVGIGENREEILDSLLALREMHASYGHIQEVIIQNFRAKPDTPMGSTPNAGIEDMLWTVSVSRLLLGHRANIQVPPNLNAGDYPVYLLAGINDWGGISPVTVDYVNPEAPWPQLQALRQRTEELGFTLRARLPLYPEYIEEERGLVSPAIRGSIQTLADDQGYAKRDR